MERFYIMKSAFSKHKYVVTSEKTSFISCRNMNFNLTELRYFYSFSKKLREILVDDINIIVVCQLEHQYLILLKLKNKRR